MEQSTFQPGDICLVCQQNGESYKLRTFYIDIDEQIVKCESSSCIYPYENDFTDSEDETNSEANQSCSPKPNSLPNLDVISFANNECDDADSVRFVEALLNNTNEIEKTTMVMNKKPELCQSEKLNQSIELGSEAESTTTSATLDTSLQSNDTDHTEDFAFIDALFSNREAEIAQMCESKSLEFIPTLPAPPPTFDMPIISFDFSNNLPVPKQERLLKEDIKPQIEIQCIQTVKAGFASTTDADKTTNMPKVSIKSLELIKTEYIKEEQVVQTAATKQLSEQTDTASSNIDTKVRISRYFETLRVKQEMLPKTFTKRKKRTNKKQHQPTKSENTAGSSLENVLAVLRNKTQK